MMARFFINEDTVFKIKKADKLYWRYTSGRLHVSNLYNCKWKQKQ